MGMCTKESTTHGVLSTHNRRRCSSVVGVCGISSGSVARQVRSRCTLTRKHKNIVPGTREITLLAFAIMLFLRIPMMFTFTLWPDKIILIRNFRKPASGGNAPLVGASHYHVFLYRQSRQGNLSVFDQTPFFVIETIFSAVMTERAVAEAPVLRPRLPWLCK